VVIVLPEDAPLIMAYACSCLSLLFYYTTHFNFKIIGSGHEGGAKTPPHRPKLLRMFNGSMFIV
jgi:hypothetical protein